MATNINSQKVRSYTPGTEQYQEIQNQQLNEALKSGTVDGILMAPGYSAVLSMNVAVKRDLADFVKQSDINASINQASFDFGDYSEPATHALKVKSNHDFTHQKSPTNYQLATGEIAIDNYDGSLYLRGNAGQTIQKVNAGSVNGFRIEKDVLASGSGEVLNSAQVVQLFRDAFQYDAATNSLTIRVPI